MPYAARKPRMSDTPPDRDEPSAAPETPRNPWVGYLVWATLLLVLYVLSCGPVYWLIGNHYLPEEVAVIYRPFNHLGDDLKHLIRHYADWWRP